MMVSSDLFLLAGLHRRIQGAIGSLGLRQYGTEA
jgi:hypothetical protein